MNDDFSVQWTIARFLAHPELRVSLAAGEP